MKFDTAPQDLIKNYNDFSPIPLDEIDINYLEKYVELCSSKNIPLVKNTENIALHAANIFVLDTSNINVCDDNN